MRILLMTTKKLCAASAADEGSLRMYIPETSRTCRFSDDRPDFGRFRRVVHPLPIMQSIARQWVPHSAVLACMNWNGGCAPVTEFTQRLRPHERKWRTT